MSTEAIHPLLGERRSGRAYAATPVPEPVLLRVLQAARWAPSCFNSQPWRFILADRHQDEAAHAAMAGLLSESNRRWAPRAPVLLLSIARLNFDGEGHPPNRHALHDVGLAVGQLTVQATAEGLVVHQMAGFDVQAARDRYQVPGDHEPVAVIALGYPGDTGELPADLAARETAPRVRKPLQELVFSGRFGVPWR